MKFEREIIDAGKKIMKWIFSIEPQKTLHETLFEIDDRITRIKENEELRQAIEKAYRAGWAQASRYLAAEVDPITTIHYENFLGISLEMIAKDIRMQLMDELQEAYAMNLGRSALKEIIEGAWERNEYRVVRMGRTAANDIFNKATMDRYEEYGIEAVRYKAKLDDRTTDICRTLHGTIWRRDDPDIKMPPSHFFCRSRVVPWKGRIPGERKFTDKQKEIIQKRDEFRHKYWVEMY